MAKSTGGEVVGSLMEMMTSARPLLYLEDERKVNNEVDIEASSSVAE